MNNNDIKECGCGHCQVDLHELSDKHSHEHEHSHGHSHSHTEGDAESPAKLIICIGAAIALTIVAQFLPAPYSLFVYIAAYLAAGGVVVLTAIKNTLRGELFDENFLMAVATVGAFAVGKYTEAVAVMVFYCVGELVQDLAVNRSRKNIASLMDIRPDFAVVIKDGTEFTLSPEDVNIDEIIKIRPGERIPLDCVVISGQSAIDASALTGESLPTDAFEGVRLQSGSINLSAVLTCRVIKEYGESTVQKILELVSEAGDKKANAEKFITRFSKIYTPCVIGLAAIIAFIPPLFGGVFNDWFYRGLIFLVVSCPCALVISVPVGFLGGIGGAAKNGILVKGGNVLDIISAPKTVIFDKTGTLTKGNFAIGQIIPSSGSDSSTLMRAAALCERTSNHPIAVSVYKTCKEFDNGEKIISHEDLPGFGVIVKTKKTQYAAGNAKLMQKLNVSIPQDQYEGTILYVAENDSYLGLVTIADEIKPNTSKAISDLRALGVQKCYMLTGDNERTAKEIATKAGLDGYKAGLLPQEKVTAYEELAKQSGGITMYAGDGINDAPLLARADAGVAMGGVGSDAAIEAADMVLMTDDIQKLATAIRVSRHTLQIVRQNITFSLGIKIVVLCVAAFGAVPMWLAIFADVGVALIAVANSARAMQIK